MNAEVAHEAGNGAADCPLGIYGSRGGLPLVEPRANDRIFMDVHHYAVSGRLWYHFCHFFADFGLEKALPACLDDDSGAWLDAADERYPRRKCSRG